MTSQAYERQRIAALSKQARTLRGRQRGTLAQYVTRQESDGRRVLTAADGGIVYGRLISTSQPTTYPVTTGAGLGRSAIVDQKPAL